MTSKKTIGRLIFNLIEILLLPVSIVYIPFIYMLRRIGIEHFYTKKILIYFGVMPIIDYYYEPQFKFPATFDPSKKRELNLDLQPEKQLIEIEKLLYKEELTLLQKGEGFLFKYDNLSFRQGDADLYYLIVRNYKPKRIIEIGSGHTTKLAVDAIKRNQIDGFQTNITCIDPYEMPWLESMGEINLIRDKVENVSTDIFTSLESGDILFIDSSHIIRPEGDVLFEFFNILPQLKKGVIIHVHDIFTPRHYLKDWYFKRVSFWNEQYLLEAFLQHNDSYEILFALNYLKNDFYDRLAGTLTNLVPDAEPGSFYIRKSK